MTKNVIWQAINRLFLPVNCLGCGTEGEWICRKCFSKLSPHLPVACTVCNKSGDNGLCQKCQKASRLDRVIALFPYGEPTIQMLLKAARNNGNSDALRCYCEMFSKIYCRILPNDGWTVSYIPISSERMKKRGFNQAEEIARLLAGARYPVKNTLRKIKDTPTRGQQDKFVRHKDMEGSMHAIGKVPRKIILCDDIITTGSTLREAARALRRSGAKQIIALTIASG